MLTVTATTARDGRCPPYAATWVRREVNPASTRPDSSRPARIRCSALAADDAGTLTWSSSRKSPVLNAQGSKPGQSANRFLRGPASRAAPAPREGERHHPRLSVAVSGGRGSRDGHCGLLRRLGAPSGEAGNAGGSRGSRPTPTRQRGHPARKATAARGPRRSEDSRRAAPGHRRPRVRPGGRAAWRAPSLREGLPVPRGPPGGSGQAARVLWKRRGMARTRPTRRSRAVAGQRAPGQQLRDDRRVDRDREVHRLGHGAAMSGGRQLGGGGPQPAVLLKSRFQRCREPAGTPGTNSGSGGRCAPGSGARPVRQYQPSAAREYTSRSGCSPARTASTGAGSRKPLGPGVGHRRGVGHHPGDAQVGQQRLAVRGEQHVAG